VCDGGWSQLCAIASDLCLPRPLFPAPHCVGRPPGNKRPREGDDPAAAAAAAGGSEHASPDRAAQPDAKRQKTGGGEGDEGDGGAHGELGSSSAAPEAVTSAMREAEKARREAAYEADLARFVIRTEMLGMDRHYR
jgi:hypothetical protein